MARIVLVCDRKELHHPTLSAMYYDEIATYLRDQGHEVVVVSGEIPKLPFDADLYLLHGLSVQRAEELPKYQQEWVLHLHPLTQRVAATEDPVAALKWDFTEPHYRFTFTQLTAVDLLLFSFNPFVEPQAAVG